MWGYDHAGWMMNGWGIEGVVTTGGGRDRN